MSAFKLEYKVSLKKPIVYAEILLPPGHFDVVSQVSVNGLKGSSLMGWNYSFGDHLVLDKKQTVKITMSIMEVG